MYHMYSSNSLYSASSLSFTLLLSKLANNNDLIKQRVSIYRSGEEQPVFIHKGDK